MPKKEENKNEEEKTLINIVPNDFPIENYLNAEGKPVICITEREAKVRELALAIDTNDNSKVIREAL